MKIELNNDTRTFINKCANNIVKFNTSNFLKNVVKINSNNKNELLRNVKRFDSEDNNLFYDKSLITENPFFKNIKIDSIKSDNLNFKKSQIPKNYAINISWLQPDEEKSLNDYTVLKACKENINVPILEEDDEVWMSPTLAEQNTINPFVDKVYGNVLTFGLGLGYFPYMCSLNSDVKSITIVELNEKLIDIFKENILPQFNSEIEINIINGDLFDYYNKDFLDKFDYIFVDVWQSNEDGLNILETLFEKNGVYDGDVDYWIEFSCYLSIRFLMVSYFNSLMNNTFSRVLASFNGNEEFKRYFKKIHKYFRNIDKTVTESPDLKEYLYNINVIREILSQKL